MISVEIQGNPLSKIRHRSRMCNGKIMTYSLQNEEVNATKNEIFKYLIDNNLLCKLDVKATAEIKISFFLETPKSWNQKKKNLLSWGLSPVCQKPDIDNLAKFYLDCANKILFEDDKQVVKLILSKKYSHKPKTIIEIMYPEKDVMKKFEKIVENLDFLEIKEMCGEAFDMITIVEDGYGDGDYPQSEQDISSAIEVLGKFSVKYAFLFSKIKKNYENWRLENEI